MNLSCLTWPPLTSGADCVADFELGISSGLGYFIPAAELRRFVDCAVSSPDCATAAACASRNHGPDYCAAHSGASCDGDVLVSCSQSQPDWAVFTNDCASLGLRCVDLHDGRASCTDGTSCDTSAHCDGNRYVSCDSSTHLAASFDCSLAGYQLECRTMSANGTTITGCFPPGPACSPDGEHCDGTTLVRCVAGGELRVDCTTWGQHCGVAASGRTTCIPNATDCTADSPDRCNGTAMEICVDGRYQAIDCSAIGLTACLWDTTLEPEARCVP
jgi:hypothetical protein